MRRLEDGPESETRVNADWGSDENTDSTRSEEWFARL